MGPLDSLIHVLNFLAPAAGVAVLTAIAARVLMKKGPAALGLPVQMAINFVVGGLLMLAGLEFFGHDGKMATYAALVAGIATSQLWLLRSGKR